jgi:hypothetical protein
LGTGVFVVLKGGGALVVVSEGGAFVIARGVGMGVRGAVTLVVLR